MPENRFWEENKHVYLKKTIFRLSWATLFFYFLTSLSQAWADNKPGISDIFLAENKGNLCLSFRLSNGLTDQIERILQSGIPIRYTFDVKLKRHRLIWKDEIRHLEIKRLIVFDNIRNEYVLSFYYPFTRDTRIISVSRLAEAKKYMFQVDNLNIIPLSRLSKSNKYSIEIKAVAKKGESSMPFSRLIKVFSSFGFETDTYEVEFRY